MHFNKLVEFVFLCLIAILTLRQTCAVAALISGQPEGPRINESSVLYLIGSTEVKNASISENLALLTPSQRIMLKEIRKLARLAGHEQPESITEFDEQLCYTNDCLEAAKEFYTSMDLSKDPCTEWKRFACEWRTLSSKYALDQHSSLSLKVENQIMDILQDPHVETGALESAKEYFRACLAWFQDFNQIDHITRFLKNFGSWPLLKGSDFDGDWVKILAEIIRIAPENASPFLFKFVAAAVNSKGVVLQIDIGSNHLDMDTEEIHELLQLLRKNSSQITEEELADIHDMQGCMQNLSMGAPELNTEKNLSIISLEELQSRLKTEMPSSKLSILKLVQTVFADTDLKISPETEVLVNVDFFIKYLHRIESVSQRTLLNIVFFQLATIILSDTTNAIQEANFLYLENYKRTLARNPLQQCSAETSEIFSYALSNEYIRRHYKSKTNQMMSNMTENLRDGFIKVVDSMKWLQESSQEFMKAKIKNVEFLVGFPNWIMNDTQLVSYYSTLKLHKNIMDGGAYLSYRNNALSWLYGKTWMMKLNDDTMDGWNYRQRSGFIGDTDVEYFSSLNQIRIPAGALQVPLYSEEFPGFMSFGGIGSVIAREMAHIIDSSGIYMSSAGDLGKWLDEKSLKSYIEWSSRLQTEWQNDKNELSLNSKITHVIAYHITVQGYEKYLKDLKMKNEEEIKLPGLAHLQPEVLLQIKYSNVQCEDPSIRRFKWGQVDQTSWGGLIPVSHTKYFLKLFDCNIEILPSAFDFE